MKPRPEEQETIAQYCDRVGCETALAYYLAKAYIESEELGYLHTVKDDIYLGMTGRSKDIALAGLSLYRDRKRDLQDESIKDLLAVYKLAKPEDRAKLKTGEWSEFTLAFLQQYPEHEAIIKWAKDGWNPESLIYPEG